MNTMNDGGIRLGNEAPTPTEPTDDPAQRLREAWAELRSLPLGGRGHLADACRGGAAEIVRLREATAMMREALRNIAKEANEGGVFYPGVVGNAEQRNAYVVQMALDALNAR